MHLQYDHQIIFDTIPVGQETKQYFTLPCTVKIAVVISQLFCISGIEHPFTVRKKYTHGVDDKIKQELIIIYAPRTPEQRYVCYYKVEIANSKEYIFRITGYCESLSIQMSVKRLDFYGFNTEKLTKKVFELQNNSNSCITYQFDIDNDQKIYDIEPLYGKLKPKSSVCITVNFVTKKTGIFLMELPCLFMYHAPIFVRLFGVNSTTADLSDLDKLKSLCSILTKSGYEKYMTDYYGCPHLESACNFSKTNFDFTNNRLSSKTEISNLTTQCMKIIWDIETKDFTVNPVKKLLCPKDKDKVECSFTPTCPDHLYASQIYGKALIYPPLSVDPVPKDETNCILVPFSMRLMGSSFTGENTWTPVVEIFPSVISMPICNPKGSVYSTFIIKRGGTYPITYKFISPRKTCFEVKPLIGIIKGEYQLFVVKFEHRKEQYNYKEIWSIQFNQRPDSMNTIKFKAIVEDAKVTVGVDNKIDFGNVFLGCKKTIKLPIYNNTQNTLKISFAESKWFKIDCGDGYINSYDTILSIWCYTASSDVPARYELKYELFIVQQNSLIVGAETVDYVTIIANCDYAKLCSSPIFYDFNQVICGNAYETSFTVFNFCDCEMHFTLKAYEHVGSSKDEPITIIPSTAFLAPQENIKITVKLFTYISFLSTYCIHYHVRVEEESDIFVEQKEEGWKTHGILFRLCYYSYYPTLKFVDIGKNSTGPLFGKVNIWEFFEIEQLNEMLSTMQANETRQINIRVPEAQLGISQGKSIVFIVKNITPVDTICKIQRKKICKCKLKQIDGSFTFRKYTYESCPHRKLLDLECSNDIIKADSIFYLTLSVTYNMIEKQKVCYLMHLSHNRTIKLYFHIASLHPGDLSTFKSGFVFDMHNVYIGELVPNMQFFYVANNTHQTSNYSLDTSLLCDLNKQMGYDMITCLNPESYVNPKQRHIIKFLFRPISVGVINIQLPILFGYSNHTLSIRGEATSSYSSDIKKIASHYKQDYYNYPNLFVHISTENIIIKNLPTHCKITRIFTLRNVTNTSCIGFWVEGDYLEDILHMSSNPSKGVLKPKELLTLVLTVHSYGTPCTLRATCPVHFIDQTALNEHIRTKTANYREAKETSDFFTITETDITYARPTTEIIPPPKIFHRTISVTCSVIDVSDIDLKIPLHDQLRHCPFTQFNFYNEKLLNDFLKHIRIEQNQKEDETKFNDEQNSMRHFKNSKDYDVRQINIHSSPIRNDDCKFHMNCCLPLNDREYIVVHSVLECLIRNVIYSEKFKYQIKYDIKNEADLHYRQFDSANLSPREETFMTKLYFNQISASLLSDTLQILIGDALVSKFNLGVYPNTVKQCNKKMKPSKDRIVDRDAYAEEFTFLLNQ